MIDGRVRPQLDLVKDNPEVRFPADGPVFRFVLWEHTVENLPQVLPFLEDCQVIAEELWYFHEEHPSGLTVEESAQQDYDTATRIMMGTATTYEKRMFSRAAERGSIDALITCHFEGSGKSMVPIDEFATTTAEDHDHTRKPYPGLRRFFDDDPTYQDAVRDDLKRSAADNKRRENTSLGQLFDLAQQYAGSKEVDTIGVLYGTNHRPLSVALSQLGAKVERRFAKPANRQTTPFDFLVRRTRFGLGEIDTISDKEIHDACVLELAVAAVYIVSKDNETYADKVETEIMSAYRNSPEECIDTILRMKNSVYEGRNPLKRHRMHKAAREVLELVGIS